MKQVVFLVPFMTGYGGTETVIKNLFEEYKTTDQDEFNFKLVEIGGYEHSEWLDNILDKKIIFFSRNKFLRKIQYVVMLPFLIPKIIKESNCDLLISTNPVMWTIAFLYKKLLSKKFKVVEWYHYSLEEKRINRFLLKSADQYLAISSGIKQQLISKNVNPSKISLIYNPILSRNTLIPRTDGDQPIRFIYVGRVLLNGQKNLKQLLDAIADVKGEWFLDIYGAGEIDKVKSYAKKLGIDDRVQMRGFMDDVWGGLQNVDYLVLTSTYEGLPMVLNEAISVGIPVISSNCETGPVDIVNSKNGFLYNYRDTTELRDILQNIVTNKIQFKDYQTIKDSIEKFYSYNYFKNFMKVIDQYEE